MTDVHSCELTSSSLQRIGQYETKKNLKECSNASNPCPDGGSCVASSYVLVQDIRYTSPGGPDGYGKRKAVYNASACKCVKEKEFVKKFPGGDKGSDSYKSFEYGKCHLLSDYIPAIYNFARKFRLCTEINALNIVIP